MCQYKRVKGGGPPTEKTKVTSTALSVSHAFLTLLFEADDAGSGGLVDLELLGHEDDVAFEAARLAALTGLVEFVSETEVRIVDLNGVVAAIKRGEQDLVAA